MTTNYGARPGPTVEPRTMSAERERVIREHNVSLTGTPRDLRDVLVELEQERILHAATLAALDRIAKIAWHGESAGAPDLPNADRWRIVAECREVFAQARGSRGAK